MKSVPLIVQNTVEFTVSLPFSQQNTCTSTSGSDMVFRYGIMNTIYAYTNDQRILDRSHKDPRRARTGAEINKAFAHEVGKEEIDAIAVYPLCISCGCHGSLASRARACHMAS
jgi:hypothetical protein